MNPLIYLINNIIIVKAICILCVDAGEISMSHKVFFLFVSILSKVKSFLIKHYK